MVAISQIRPSGPLRWILPKLAASSDWTIIGTVSAEERCLAAVEEAARILGTVDIRMLHITLDHRTTHSWMRMNHDLSVRNSVKARQLFGDKVLKAAGRIFDDDHTIIRLSSEVAQSCRECVLLDISTMPKRFFFPLLTKMLECNRIKTLVVTNTSPHRYGKELARDPGDWNQLPIYCGDSNLDVHTSTVLIGVGYHTLNIRDILEQQSAQNVEIKLMLPVPSLHPGFMANWDFIHSIKTEWDRQVRTPIEIIRVPNHDPSVAFDWLARESKAGFAQSLILAPFGPKPLSLAMCLLGVARAMHGLETEIGYTQPLVYAPDYSSGVAISDGHPVVASFCVKLDGRMIYSI